MKNITIPFLALALMSTASYAESASDLSAHPQCIIEHGDELHVKGAVMVGDEPVPGATVYLTTATGVQAEAVSGLDGIYTATFKAPGAKSVAEYRTTVKRTGTLIRRQGFTLFSTRCVKPEVTVGT